MGLARAPASALPTPPPDPCKRSPANPFAGVKGPASSNRLEGTHMASVVTTRQLLEAGVHFGHQTRRWNPKMKRFIYGARNGIYIIDLHQTIKLFEDALEYVRKVIE